MSHGERETLAEKGYRKLARNPAYFPVLPFLGPNPWRPSELSANQLPGVFRKIGCDIGGWRPNMTCRLSPFALPKNMDRFAAAGNPTRWVFT